MARRLYRILKEFEVTKAEIRAWLDNSPPIYQITSQHTDGSWDVFHFNRQNHQNCLREFLNPRHDSFLAEMLQNRRTIGLLGEVIGELILKQDFALNHSYIFESPIKSRPLSMIQDRIESENLILDSFYLARLFSAINGVTVTPIGESWITTMKNLYASKYDLAEHEDKKDALFLFTYHYRTDECQLKQLRNTITYEQFCFSFDQALLDEIAPQIKEHLKSKEKRRSSENCIIRLTQFIKLWDLATFFSPDKAQERGTWHRYLFSRRRWADRFSELASFLATHSYVDVINFLSKNRAAFDHSLGLDVWATPIKKRSEFAKHLYAVDYKGNRLTCTTHGKYNKPSLSSLQRDYIKKLRSTEIGVLFLTIGICECGRVFCKYLERID